MRGWLAGIAMHDTIADLYHAKVRVSGPKGEFEGFLLLSTGWTSDLSLSENYAFQLGITKELRSDS